MAYWRWVEIAAGLGVVLLLGACGQPGAPIAPSLELPRAVDDLSATRKGDRVALRWTPPNRFTDGRTIRRMGPTHICRSSGTASACNVVGTVPAPPDHPKGKKRVERVAVEFQDTLPANLLQASPMGSVKYGVEVLNTHDRGIGLSNQVEISTAPALAPPANLTSSLSNIGVTLAWQPLTAPNIPGISFVYRISRRGETGDFVSIATVPVEQSKYTDQAMEWEKKSEYRIVVLSEKADGKQVLVEGEDSPTVSVFAHDVFPPEPPHELQAVFSGPGQQAFIDLSWTPNLEADLAGYNVYRHEEGAEAVRMNPHLVTSPSYRDQQIEAGKKYFYSISAVDIRGNESAKSSETSETVP
jgi:hypothetical protein